MHHLCMQVPMHKQSLCLYACYDSARDPSYSYIAISPAFVPSQVSAARLQQAELIARPHFLHVCHHKTAQQKLQKIAARPAWLTCRSSKVGGRDSRAASPKNSAATMQQASFTHLRRSEVGGRDSSALFANISAATMQQASRLICTRSEVGGRDSSAGPSNRSQQQNRNKQL